MSVSMIRMDIDDDQWASTELLDVAEALGALVHGFVVNGGHVVTVVQETFRGFTGVKLSVRVEGAGYQIWFITGQAVL